MTKVGVNRTLFNSPSANGKGDCALIHLEGVSKIYRTEAGDFPALKDIDLCFGEGEFVSVMGKSGSGKSTLVNMITGIDHPSAGNVRVGGVDIHRMSEGDLAVWRGRTLGVVFQFFQLLPMLSVLENTMLPMDFCNMYLPEEREGRAMRLLEMLGLVDVAEDLPAALSGGQQQIAALARALANDPPIIVADEPTGNLDSRTAERVLDIFADLAEKGKTIIIVTHDTDLGQRTKRQVLLSDGELIDEQVAKTLPMLSHPQMLQVTRQVQSYSFKPGAIIAHNGGAEAGLYLVTQGQVEVLRNGSKRPPEVVALIEPGEYFGELDMLEEGNRHLSFRASNQSPVDLLWLNSEAFQRLITGGKTANEVFRRAAWEHNQFICHTQVNGIEEEDDD